MNQIDGNSDDISIYNRWSSCPIKSIGANVSISRIIRSIILIPRVDVTKNSFASYSLIKIAISDFYLFNSEVCYCAFGNGKIAYKVMEWTITNFNYLKTVSTQMHVEVVTMWVAGMLKTLKLFTLCLNLWNNSLKMGNLLVFGCWLFF